MYVKKNLFLFIIACAFFIICGGCQTRPVVITTDESIVGSQISAGKLETIHDSIRSILHSMMFGLETQLQSQSMELTTLSTRLTDTMLSFRNLSAELDNLNIQLTKEQERVQTRNKILFWFGIIGAIILLGKIIAFILYAKRVPIPRWLDIVL